MNEKLAAASQRGGASAKPPNKKKSKGKATSQGSAPQWRLPRNPILENVESSENEKVLEKASACEKDRLDSLESETSAPLPVGSGSTTRRRRGATTR